MPTALAQSANLFEVVPHIFSRLDTLAHPESLLEALQNLSVVWGTTFVIAGIICLLHGYRYYRVVAVVLALAIGGFGGYVLGQHVGPAYIIAACLAALLAVSCWPLMKYTVAVLGGLAGAFIGANTWTAIIAAVQASDGNAYAPIDSQGHWIGALIGLVVCGLLAFILFKLSVVLFTSVSGATVALLGALGLLLQVPGWSEGIRSAVGGSAVVLPLLVIVPATIGLILQETRPEAKEKQPAAKPA